MSLSVEELQLILAGKALFAPLNFSVLPGQVLSIMGPSGCGKSSLLAAIIGDLPPCFTLNGRVQLQGRELTTLPIHRRQVGLLHQESLLFGHLNVGENLAFAIPSTVVRSERRWRIEQALVKAGLADFAKRDVSSLSGGQKARISLLRTLLSEPKALLLDEPFSKLDLQLRQHFRQWVFELIAEQQIPTILVTHDRHDCPNEPLLLQPPLC